METGTCSLRSVFKKGSCSNWPLLLMFFSLGGFVPITLIDLKGLFYQAEYLAKTERRLHIAALSAMAQRVIHQHASQHGLGNRRRAQADAGIVAPGGLDGGRGAVPVDGAPG